MNDIKVPKRIENSIINALQGGVVPRVGLGYIAVGREQEIKALLKDIEIIQEGGSKQVIMVVEKLFYCRR